MFYDHIKTKYQVYDTGSGVCLVHFCNNHLCFILGTLKLRIVGHRTSMSDIHYIPQSPFVLTHGKYEEQTLRLWDKKSMQQISSFKTDEDVSV